MRTFQGENPSVLQLEILNELMAAGEECAPRGKKIKEIRPASVEFLNPLKRVTFLRGRRINPYFQIAESLWILSGRSDVAFLDLFNKNMVNFSDDGKFFNASYGERIRFYGKNDLHHVVYNPIDQLVDCYIKLTEDPDTRQAVIVISHPQFDNSSYTIGEKGKDIACNLIITFKIRDGRLNMTVFNRSNDLIWGLFGANLCQFSTIQEMLATWLGVEVGTYHQVTDSLHLYTEDYGASGNQEIFDYHVGLQEGCLTALDLIQAEESIWWEFKTEPRMSMGKELTELFIEFFWSSIAPKLADDEFISANAFELLNVLNTDSQYLELTDDYWRMAISAMVAYRFIRLKSYDNAIKVLSEFVPDCSWKVSMIYFIKTLLESQAEKGELSNDLADAYANLVEDFTNSHNLVNGKEELQQYLDFSN